MAGVTRDILFAYCLLIIYLFKCTKLAFVEYFLLENASEFLKYWAQVSEKYTSTYGVEDFCKMTLTSGIIFPMKNHVSCLPLQGPGKSQRGSQVFQHGAQGFGLGHEGYVQHDRDLPQSRQRHRRRGGV